jgi:hypothetical protein
MLAQATLHGFPSPYQQTGNEEKSPASTDDGSHNEGR